MSERIAKALERIAEALEQIQKTQQGQVRQAEDAPKKAQELVDGIMKSISIGGLKHGN